MKSLEQGRACYDKVWSVIKTGDDQQIKALIENSVDPILHKVCVENPWFLLVIIEPLLRNGLDINATDTEGSTVLHIACAQLVVKHILNDLIEKHGANVLVRNRDGQTPCDVYVNELSCSEEIGFSGKKKSPDSEIPGTRSITYLKKASLEAINYLRSKVDNQAAVPFVVENSFVERLELEKVSKSSAISQEATDKKPKPSKNMCFSDNVTLQNIDGEVKTVSLEDLESRTKKTAKDYKKEEKGCFIQ